MRMILPQPYSGGRLEPMMYRNPCTAARLSEKRDLTNDARHVYQLAPGAECLRICDATSTMATLDAARTITVPSHASRRPASVRAATIRAQARKTSPATAPKTDAAPVVV